MQQADYMNNCDTNNFDFGRNLQTPLPGKRPQYYGGGKKQKEESDSDMSDQENSTFDSFDERR